MAEAMSVDRAAQRLGVPLAPSSKAELKKIFHAKSIKFHPDKGGNPDDMKDLSRWYTHWKHKVAFLRGWADEMSKVGSYFGIR
jgi:curved DNA-binding protein CbpA